MISPMFFTLTFNLKSYLQLPMDDIQISSNDITGNKLNIVTKHIEQTICSYIQIQIQIQMRFIKKFLSKSFLFKCVLLNRT